MQRSYVSALIVLGICCVACGSSNSSAIVPTTSDATSSETSTVSGSVEGHALTPRSAVFAHGAGNDNSLYVVLSSQQTYCANLEKGVTTPNHVSLVFGLNTVRSDATTPRPSAGTFLISTQAQQGAGNQAQGAFNVSNATCGNALSGDSSLTGGSVTLATVTDTRVAGNFNVTVGDAHVVGTFDTADCAGLAAQISSGGSLTCEK